MFRLRYLPRRWLYRLLPGDCWHRGICRRDLNGCPHFPGLAASRCDTLYLLQFAVGITEGDYFTGQFIDEISELTVRAECEVARAGVGSDIGRFTG